MNWLETDWRSNSLVSQWAPSPARDADIPWPSRRVSGPAPLLTSGVRRLVGAGVREACRSVASPSSGSLDVCPRGPSPWGGRLLPRSRVLVPGLPFSFSLSDFPHFFPSPSHLLFERTSGAQQPHVGFLPEPLVRQGASTRGSGPWGTFDPRFASHPGHQLQPLPALGRSLRKKCPIGRGSVRARFVGENKGTGLLANRQVQARKRKGCCSTWAQIAGLLRCRQEPKVRNDSRRSARASPRVRSPRYRLARE